MLSVVTGAYGLVGANLVRSLLDRGDEVRAAGRVQAESLAGLGVEHADIDVLDPASLAKAFAGADHVFHVAAIISIVGDPSGIVHRVNVEGPRNATKAALDAGVTRFIHCSSVDAFDLEKCGPELTEEGPRTTGGPAPAYDRSKYEGEQQVQATIADGLDAVIVNPTGVMGPNDFVGSRLNETLLQLRDRKSPSTSAADSTSSTCAMSWPACSAPSGPGEQVRTTYSRAIGIRSGSWHSWPAVSPGRSPHDSRCRFPSSRAWHRSC